MLKERYINYLKKQAHNPVSKEVLLEKAIKAGYGEKKAKQVLYELRDDEMLVQVGNWFGAKLYDRPHDKDQERTLWFCYYEMSDEEIKQKQEDIKWFNKL